MAEEKSKDDKKTEPEKTEPALDGSTINVKIYSPFKIYFDGPAKSISAENDTGPFDILPKHHNFMTLLNPGDVTVVRESGEQKYKIARGVMHVKKNQVIVFLDV